jgi:deferrochelatase/peroxidase EfeB
MRKTKPRSVIGNDDKFDIMRRGIPYGVEMDADEKKGPKSQKDRGLLFVCYQTSLSNGFQFIKNRKLCLTLGPLMTPLTPSP